MRRRTGLRSSAWCTLDAHNLYQFVAAPVLLLVVMSRVIEGFILFFKDPLSCGWFTFAVYFVSILDEESCSHPQSRLLEFGSFICLHQNDSTTIFWQLEPEAFGQWSQFIDQWSRKTGKERPWLQVLCLSLLCSTTFLRCRYSDWQMPPVLVWTKLIKIPCAKHVAFWRQFKSSHMMEN